MWLICREFKILPNDPMLKAITPVQMTWMLANMEADNEAMRDALGRGQGKQTISNSSELNGM